MWPSALARTIHFSLLLEVAMTVTPVRCPVECTNGKIYTDQRDPIEGHKLSNVGPCPMCNGRGYFDPESIKGKAVAAYWQTLHDLYVAEKERQAREQQRREEVLKKLDDETKEVLAHFGLDKYFIEQKR